MKTTVALMALSSLAMPLVSAWLNPPSQGLIKVDPQDRPGSLHAVPDRGLQRELLDGGQERAPVFDRGAWRDRLLTSDLEAREESYEELVELARGSEEVRDLLEAWAEDSYELELAWTARLALREVRADRQPVAPWGSGSGRNMPLMLDDMRELQEQMRALDAELEQRFGLRQPRSFGGWPFGGKGSSPFDWSLPDPSQPFEGSGEALRFESGPHGVKVEVQVQENGETKTEVYEAESLEELLEVHPELEGRLSTGPGLGGLPVPSLDDLFGQRKSRLIDPRDLGRGAAPRTDVLGVLMRGAQPGEVLAPGLKAGQGLLVQSVVPSSLAKDLGVRSGDILWELQGQALRSGDDVRRALAQRADGEELVLVVVRNGEFQQLRR